MSATIFIATAETDSIRFVLRGDAPNDRIKQAITDVKSTVNSEQTLIFDATVHPVTSGGTRVQSVTVTVDKPHKPTLFAFLVSKLRRAVPDAHIGLRGDDTVQLSDANGVAHLVQRIMRESTRATAAAEPQPGLSKHFDFYVWERNTSSGYPTEMIAEVSRIIHESGAVIDKPSISIKHASGVAGARRVHLRITTARCKETVRALLSQLPKYRGFVAFCNDADADADDSFILPSDRQGIAELVRTLAREWRS